MTTTTTSFYPWFQWISSTGGFHGAGAGKQKTFTFPDTISNVSSIDFSGMTTSNGSSISIRNTTSQVDGSFTATVYDENGNAIGASTVSVKKSSTVKMNTLSKITLPSNSSVKTITFYSTTRNAHMSLSTDATSEFKITYERESDLISFTPYSSAADWISSKSGSNFRIVQRVDNAYRKIANSSDVVVLDSLQFGELIHGLVPGETYLLVLQQKVNEWFDIDQDTITTKEISITNVSMRSSTITAEWEEDYPGALYSLIATSPTGSSLSTQTTDLSATVTGLSPGTNYVITIESQTNV